MVHIEIPQIISINQSLFDMLDRVLDSFVRGLVSESGMDCFKFLLTVSGICFLTAVTSSKSHDILVW